jgi:hypothetical protein
MSEDQPLSKNLAEHYKAIESEFIVSPDNEPVAVALTKLNNLLDEATQALEQLLIGGESEAVRMSGIKLVFEYTLGKPGVSNGNEDELSKLVQSLTKPAEAKAPKSA